MTALMTSHMNFVSHPFRILGYTCQAMYGRELLGTYNFACLFFQHINDLSGCISMEDTLRKAYGTFLQLEACKKDLPESVSHILGMTE